MSIVENYKAIYPKGHKIRDILLEHGRVFESPKYKHRRIDGGQHSEMKACYKNAWYYCNLHPRAVYYEGFYMDNELGIPLEHAWCVIDGKLFDPTLGIDQERFSYLGVAISMKRVNEAAFQCGYFGYFANAWLHGSLKRK